MTEIGNCLLLAMVIPLIVAGLWGYWVKDCSVDKDEIDE